MTLLEVMAIIIGVLCVVANIVCAIYITKVERGIDRLRAMRLEQREELYNEIKRIV